LYTKSERAREFYEDVVSYCILRTKENQRIFYSIQSLPQFINRFKKKIQQMSEQDIEEENEMNQLLSEEIKHNKLTVIDNGIFTFHSQFKLL